MGKSLGPGMTDETAVGPRLARTPRRTASLLDQRCGQSTLGHHPDHPAKCEREHLGVGQFTDRRANLTPVEVIEHIEEDPCREPEHRNDENDSEYDSADHRGAGFGL